MSFIIFKGISFKQIKQLFWESEGTTLNEKHFMEWVLNYIDQPYTISFPIVLAKTEFELLDQLTLT